jgi:hypothetical protein
MKKIDFFKKAMNANCYYKKAWIISAFSITNEKTDNYLSDPYPYRLVCSQTSMGFVDPENNNKLSYIEDYEPAKPLFKFTERITIDSSVCINALSSIETTVGNVIVNLAVLVYAFKEKIPFVTGVFDIRKIEDIIAKGIVRTDSESEPKLLIEEYIKFVDALSYISSLSFLCVYAATEKSMTTADDFPEYKDKLLKEYSGKLNDPIFMEEFERKLQQKDEEYLKDDPSNNKFLKGKIKDIARKKMYLTMGGEAGFSEGLTLTPLTNSLDEGLSRDPEQFVAAMNGIRNGTYKRGIETEQGGTSYKVLLRAGSNFKIIKEDCGTLLGIERQITDSNFSTLVGRMVLKNNRWQLVESEETAKALVSNSVIVRSPMYCLHEGDRICEHCAGKRLSLNPLVLGIGLVEVSSVIITTSMKAMHGSTLQSKLLDLDRVLS